MRYALPRTVASGHVWLSAKCSIPHASGALTLQGPCCPGSAEGILKGTSQNMQQPPWGRGRKKGKGVKGLGATPADRQGPTSQSKDSQRLPCQPSLQWQPQVWVSQKPWSLQLGQSLVK